MKKIILLILLINFTHTFSQKNDTSQKTESILLNKKHPILNSKIFINAGLYVPTKSLRLKVNGNTPNNDINFNEKFKLKENEATFAANFVWRFAKKWTFGVEYFAVTNSKNINLDADINWEDTTYKAGANIDMGLKINMFRVFFGRIISSGIKHELGAGIGVHAMNITTFIQGDAYINNQNAGFKKKNLTFTAPLPNIGAWYTFAPTEKWAFTTRIDWFGVKIDNYSGNLWNIAPGVKYQIFNNLGVGLNYRYLSLSFDAERKYLNGGFDLIYKGPLFTISANF